MKDKLNLYIDKELKEKIKIQAIKESRTASNIVEELFYKYLQEQEGAKC